MKPFWPGLVDAPKIGYALDLDADENSSCATGVVAPYLRAPTGGGDVIQAEGFDSACMRPERTRGLLFFVLIFHFFFFLSILRTLAS